MRVLTVDEALELLEKTGQPKWAKGVKAVRTTIGLKAEAAKLQQREWARHLRHLGRGVRAGSLISYWSVTFDQKKQVGVGICQKVTALKCWIYWSDGRVVKHCLTQLDGRTMHPHQIVVEVF